MKDDIIVKDVFISYKNDGEGNNFAARLEKDLTDRGFSVYFNPNEQHSGDFPERLRQGVKNCNHLLLIVTKACLEQLIKNEEVDWIREEVLTAKQNNINIIPILMPNVCMPKQNTVMPEALQFLPLQDAITVSSDDNYYQSPFDRLISWLVPKKDEYRDAFNLNSNYNLQQRYSELKAESESGSIPAKYELAILYYYGFTNDDGKSLRDYNKAFKLFNEVYRSEGSLKYHAATMIARMYNDGIAEYGEQSFEKALEYHKIASIESRESAQTVAYMNFMSRGCDFDYSTTESLFSQQCQTGNDMVKYDMAKFYLTYGNYQKAYETFRSMKKKSSVALYEMGMLEKAGVLSNPIKPNFDRAARCFQEAIDAEVPYAPAARELGTLYFNGAGEFPVDFEKAKEYYEKGASLGDSSCYYMLGFLYEFGLLKRDLTMALKYFLCADEKGDRNSAHHLAMIYQQPEIQNYQKAFQYAAKSANNGKPEGEFICANLLLFGRGCEPNVNEAIKYYKRAAGQGYYPAFVMLEKLEK